ncbi:MAG: L,D-transpeptidase family protein [Nevskiales bacterium]
MNITRVAAGFGLWFSLALSLAVHAAPPIETNHEPLRADRVVLRKADRLLELYNGDELLKSYTISLGRNPVGHKQQQGDSRTPEGEYVLDWRNPRSQFHRSLHISYPDAEDRASAKKRGVAPGGDIFLHGSPNGLAGSEELLSGMDWTDGCIAVTNREIEEIWRAVRDGTPITILP